MLHKEVVLKKDNILSFIVKLICSLSLFLWLSISHAEDLGRYISSEPIKLNDDLTIEAGVTVNFLGANKSLAFGFKITFLLDDRSKFYRIML